MKCPKCGHLQEDTVTCQACGLVFEKYRQYLARRAAQQQNQSSPVKPTPTNRPAGPVLIVVVAVVACILGGVYFFSRKTPSTAALSTPPIVTTSPTTSAATVRPAVAEGHDIVALLNQNAPAGNLIEQARNATVLIQTPWGLGSGFFVKDDCTIVSNRHVVQLNEDAAAEIDVALEKVRREAARMEAVIDNDKAKLQKYYARNYSSSTDRKAQIFEEEIAAKEEALEALTAQISEAEDKFGAFSSDRNLQIILADGTEFSGSVYRISDTLDLAVVKIDGGGYCPVIPVGSSDGLHQGDRLYTIGSPMGVRHTVTSGIYSGRIDLKGDPMLQTDAPINPGNSGGPLINSDGEVLGVNTLVMNNAQGIGFSIPIEQALQAFPFI